MSTVLSSTWHISRLGSQVSPCWAAFLTSRTSCSAQVQALRSIRCLENRHRLHQYALHHINTQVYRGSLANRCLTALKNRNDSRCISIWKEPPKTPEVEQRKLTGEDISLSPSEIDKLFGQKMNPETGIEILTTLQDHRNNGTLDQGVSYNKALVARGLAWLRRNNPIDEDAAIIARIDRELDQTPQVNPKRSPQAVSQFEERQKFNKEKRKVEEERHKADDEAKLRQEASRIPEQTKMQTKKQTAPSKDLVKLRPEPNWVRNHRDKATNQDKSMTTISTWARLGPSGALVVTVFTLSLLFAQNYTQPSQDARLWPSLPPVVATVSTIIGLNVVVFLMWRLPPFWKFLNRNCLIAPVYPHAMSMLGGPFSHQHPSHLFANCCFLWLIGCRVHDDIGRGTFLALFFSSAVIASYIPMVIYVLRNTLTTTTLGASGTVCALISTGCVLHEGLPVHITGLPPEWARGIDTGVILALFILLEVLAIRRWGITPPVLNAKVKPTRPHVDNMGHLTGYLAGLAGGAYIRATDPYWGSRDRHHFLTKDFGKGKERKPSESMEK